MQQNFRIRVEEKKKFSLINGTGTVNKGGKSDFPLKMGVGS
jgi:hypothetical protein